ncbi:hypothetical protein T05_2665 [Trichinella murrelli]|uniref:Uncharacterized protein n=1 Tax=Trichinella murrelli TaxID=144512 RepID=A0A0V0THX7_9BILA|nr:hypothetical protein T05_2665 [Trichinella murrelli]
MLDTFNGLLYCSYNFCHLTYLLSMLSEWKRKISSSQHVLFDLHSKGFVKLYNRIEQNTPDNPTIDDN